MAKICTKPGGKVYVVTKGGKVLPGESDSKRAAEVRAALVGGKVLTICKTINWNCGRPTEK